MAIDELGQKVVDAFYQNKEKPKGKGVEVSLSAAAFVPKPFTPFQWFGQDTMEMLQEKQRALKGNVSLPQTVRQLPRRPDQLFGGRVRPWAIGGCAP